MALVGKPCPRVTTLVFIKGEPVEIPAPGNPLIVEFWASWCGPCRAAFPHLSSLRRKHAGQGLKVVGVSMEDEAPSKAFVERQVRCPQCLPEHTRAHSHSRRRLPSFQGSNMDYSVAVDPGQRLAQGLMGAAGVSGIPHAFVIDRQGIIRHHGHPMEPKFAAAVAEVCQEAAGGGADGGGGAAPPPQQEQRALPAVTQSREELMAMPVRELKAILTDRKIG